jgi:hypothetical protein
MMTIYAPHQPYTEHLEMVKAQMQTLGSPAIRAFWSGDAWYAIEGSHRLAAAHELGLEPEIIEVEYDTVISDHDFPDLDDTCAVADIIEYLYDRPDTCYQF